MDPKARGPFWREIEMNGLRVTHLRPYPTYFDQVPG